MAYGRVAAAALAAILLSLGLASPSVGQDALDRIKSEKVARVAVANEAPYGYMTEDGRITGEAPEIARHVLSQIDPDIEIEGSATDFGQLIPGLKDNAFDIAAAGMFITPARCAEVAFSDPTYVIGESFLVRAGNPKELTGYEAVAANEEARLGVMAGAVEYNYAYEVGIPVERVELYPDYGMALKALREGEIDAIGMTALTVRSLLEREDDPALAMTEQFFPRLDGEEVKGYGGFAFNSQSEALVAAFNEVLAEFIGSPAHQELVRPFGFTEDMLPDKTTEELCTG